MACRITIEPPFVGESHYSQILKLLHKSFPDFYSRAESQSLEAFPNAEAISLLGYELTQTWVPEFRMGEGLKLEETGIEFADAIRTNGKKLPSVGGEKFGENLSEYETVYTEFYHQVGGLIDVPANECVLHGFRFVTAILSVFDEQPNLMLRLMGTSRVAAYDWAFHATRVFPDTINKAGRIALAGGGSARPTLYFAENLLGVCQSIEEYIQSQDDKSVLNGLDIALAKAAIEALNSKKLVLPEAEFIQNTVDNGGVYPEVVGTTEEAAEIVLHEAAARYSFDVSEDTRVLAPHILASRQAYVWRVAVEKQFMRPGWCSQGVEVVQLFRDESGRPKKGLWSKLFGRS
jgi:hypothetical protein